MKNPAWLLEHKKNVYSQCGEDGIIKKILEMIPNKNNWCVEFGAWDGIHLSNTCRLIKEENYAAVLIEGNSKKHRELVKNFKAHSDVYCLNQYVGYSEADNLDKLLAATPIPQDFDFLSIDIDGNDYHVWKFTKIYRPKIVCIEFNPTIPTEVDFIQPADPKINFSSSLSSLVSLGQEKKYELVSVTAWNAIFVEKDLFPLFNIFDNSPQTLRKDLSQVTYLFVGFDGRIFLQGNKTLPWHYIPIDENKIQTLPKLLQKYSGNYNIFEKFLFKLLFQPSRLIPAIFRELKASLKKM